MNYLGLVVDDSEDIHRLLEFWLGKEGITLAHAYDGDEGVIQAIARADNLSFILVDVNMPGKTGFQVCEILKADPHTTDIPILFLSMEMEEVDKVRGLDLGATDYITKPFNQGELRARIRATLRTKDLRDQTQRQAELIAQRNQELTRKNDELLTSIARTQATQKQLLQSEKMASLGTLVAGLSHEINTPLGVVLTAVSHVETELQKVQQSFQEGHIRKTDLEKCLATGSQGCGMALKNLNRMTELVQTFKSVAADHAHDRKRRLQLLAYTEEVLRCLASRLNPAGHHLDIRCDDDVLLETYPGVYAQIITQLILNSLAHGFVEEQIGTLCIAISQQPSGGVHIEYSDNGQGISAENLPQIFDPFFTTQRSDGSGLGLHITFNLVTHTLGGTISCQSKPGEGATFLIDLPA